MLSVSVIQRFDYALATFGEILGLRCTTKKSRACELVSANCLRYELEKLTGSSSS